MSSLPFNFAGDIFTIEHYFYTQKYTSNYQVSLHTVLTVWSNVCVDWAGLNTQQNTVACGIHVSDGASPGRICIHTQEGLYALRWFFLVRGKENQKGCKVRILSWDRDKMLRTQEAWVTRLGRQRMPSFIKRQKANMRSSPSTDQDQGVCFGLHNQP